MVTLNEKCEHVQCENFGFIIIIAIMVLFDFLKSGKMNRFELGPIIMVKAKKNLVPKETSTRPNLARSFFGMILEIHFCNLRINADPSEKK